MVPRSEILEPMLSAVMATEGLLGRLQIDHAFVGEVALAAWLGRPAASSAVDVLALLAPDRCRQVPMMASNNGFLVDEDEVMSALELDLIPMRFEHTEGSPRVHILMATNALYSKMLRRTHQVEVGDDAIPIVHPEDLGLLLAMQEARDTLDALIESVGDLFDRDRAAGPRARCR